MPFIEKIKQIATGKSETERRQEAAATQIIRRKALAAQLREREKQSIRLATERERISADQRLKKMKEPKQRIFAPVVGELKTYGDPFGQPRFVKQRVVRVKGKKGKTKKKILRTSPRYNIRQAIAPQRYDVLGI